MEIDWDLELSHQVNLQNSIIKDKQFESDLMLQPITTQQKFNLKQKNKLSASSDKKQDFNSGKQIQSVQQELTTQKSTKDNQNLAQEARKFREYLNDKVQELRKSKQKISLKQSQFPEQKSKTSNLRKIINKQGIKSKQNDKFKAEPQLENINYRKATNLVNKTATEIKTTSEKITPLKKLNDQNEEHEKRLTNSQSNLMKNLEKKNFTVVDVKKSMNLDQNSKTPKLPELTAKLKIPFPTKSEANSSQNRTDNRKSTIDSLMPKQPAQKQRRKTPESKRSFRIKRTSNAQPSQKNIIIDIKKSNEVSLKTIEKEKQKSSQSPLHQGKNKKMREEFMKFNEEERKIQEEILKHHHQTKKVLESMMKKYQLSSDTFQKYGIRKEIDFPNQSPAIQKSPTKKEPKQSRIEKAIQKQIAAQTRAQSPLKKEEKKNKFLGQELEKINHLLKARQNNIKKYESRVEKNALMQFIQFLPQDIEQESQQDEKDQIQQLPQQSGIKADPKYDKKQFSSTYSSVMTEMKNKKWGLKQRITFETHRQQPDAVLNKRLSQGSEIIGSSNKNIRENSRLPESAYEEENNDPYSKIKVNSRLKNLLLD